MARCKSCGKEIKWMRTVGGKSIPCDPEPVYYRFRLGAKERIVTPNGEVLPCVLLNAETDDLTDADGWGYVSHFATCPKADKHRKER